MTRTRCRGTTFTSPSPSAAASPSAAGVSTWPACSTVVPAVTSSPARRRCWPGLAPARIVTVSVPPSVASTGTTAVRPGGQWRARHDPVRGAGSEGEQIGASSRNVFGDRQFHGVFVGCVRDVVGEHRVSVHRRVVEPGQRQRGHHVGGQHQSECIGEGGHAWRAWRDQPGDDALMFLDGSHVRRGS